MKIDVRRIVRDHFSTLRDAKSGKILFSDILLFYVLPVVFSVVLIDFTNPSPKTDWGDQSLTFFGIFLALLINVQVALFAILQRGRTTASNAKRSLIQQEELDLRRVLLGEMNATLSYLNLICVAAIGATLVMALVNLNIRATVLILVVFYSHFLLTMLMVLKRSHALFQKEYGSPQSHEG